MPEEKSIYSLPSTSRRTQPVPDSKETGNSFTWPLRPLKCFVQRSCQCFDCGPGGGTGRWGTRCRSTRPHFRVEKDGGTEVFMGKESGRDGDDLGSEPGEALERGGGGGSVGDEDGDVGQRAVAGEGGLADLRAVGKQAGLGRDAAHELVDASQSEVGVVDGAAGSDAIGTLEGEVGGELLKAVLSGGGGGRGEG